MKEFFLLLLLVLLTRSHIYSSTPRVTYNYNGGPLYFSLFMSLQNGIGASDYLRFNFYEKMYSATKDQITVKLITFSNNLQVATANCANDGLGVTILHATFGYAMQPNTWYEVQVYPNQAVALTAPLDFLVQVLAVSTYSANNIIYDSNLAFGYIDVLSPLATTGTLAIVGNSSSSQKNVPAAIYAYDVYITPTVSSSTGGNFTIYIYYNSGDATHSTGTSLNDFTFMGLCQSAATATNAAAVLNYCSISSDLSTITFSVNTVTANQAIRISTSVSNPPYYSIRGIKGYWTEFISGKVYQNGLVNNALQVSQISINTVSPRVQLFWGIDGTYTDGIITTALPLFKNANASPKILQYNSFNIGFSFAATSPITGRYIVQMTIGAQGVLEASIAHNLPAYSGSTVYCYYTSPNIFCKNVGAFINTGYRYFISGKAFFSSGTASPLATFGAVAITPVVYDNSGNLISSPQLYISLAGQSTTVAPSQEFLDTSGYHNTGLFQIGNAQVVSFYDDESLSSTANAIQGFLQGTNSTVGVVPDLGTSQQLLFLLNTPTGSISSGLNAATSFTIQLMFNNAVIGFQTSGAGRGLDFVGYGTANSVWSITTSPCYFSTVVCEKYNNNTPTVNTKTLVNSGASSNYYGMYNFQCGSSYTTPTGCASNCATECTMFTGYTLNNMGSSVMAMRQITLPSGYHSPIYADGNLLDFLFIFSQGAQVISYCLINGYTVTGADMSNIKAAYVNYFDNTAGAYNKGSRIPMMVRIGGGVLPSESVSATAIGIFFDDNVDASTFYTSTGSSWAIGCSTATCSYFPNKGLNNPLMDSWLTSRSVQVYNLPPIQNQFNILVPVTPDSNNHNPPRILTIAFFSQNYSVGGVSGLLQTLAVYRLFGPVTTNSVSGSIGYINGLARNAGGSGATPDVELNADYFYTSGSFTVALNTSNMYSNPTNNTFTYGNTDSAVSFGTSFGAGYTITSFYYNIFASSTLMWDQPPANTATTCTLFGYVYNQIQNPGGNAYKNGQWMYVGFCPIDATFNVQSSAANIDFLNPQYPTFLTNNFNLRSILTYGYSSQVGYLRAYRREASGISTLVRSCTTAKLATYNPSSSGKQRATFTLTTPAITLGTYNGHIGYMSFRINFAIPASTVGSSGLVMLTACDVSLSSLSCTVTSASPSLVQVTIAYTGTTTTTITYLQVNLYATTTSTFGTAAAYTVTVYLPQWDTNVNDYTPFGNSYSSAATYATCTSSFTVGITPYGTTMNLNSLSLNSVMERVRSKITFSFGASSYRDAFFSTSTFLFNFGFLTNPNSATYYGRSNFRCMIFEGTNASSLSLSSSWSTLTLSSFASVTVAPKAEIPNPASIFYNMTCYGGAVPDGTSSTAISGSWQDNSVAVQSATGISWNAANYLTTIPNTATLLLNYKRFSTSGFKSLYSFQLTCNTALTSSAVFYFDFHMSLSPYLDNEGSVECYLRTAMAIVDASASFTYCTFVNPWQLMVWNNNALSSGTSLYVDVFNIDQPKNGDLNGNSKIGLTIDNDNNYNNGIAAYIEVTDSQPPNSAAADIFILTTSVDNSYILSTQTLTMTIDTQATTIFNAANSIYVLFPSSYSQWIARAQTLSITYPASTSTIYCEFNVTGSSTNLATACTFISQRILKISVAIATNQHLFSLRLMNLMTPASVPNGKYNQYRFKLFVSDGTQTTITYYTFTDFSQHLSLTTNPSLIALSWNYYGLSVTDSMYKYTPLTGQVITIQQGYYSNAIELRQSIYPSNFEESLTLTLTNYGSTYFSFLGGSLAVVLGKPLAYFRIAGAAAPAGLYTLVFTKSGDTNNQYTNIPPLTLVVQNTMCALSTDAATYTLPIGGSTLPILINAVNCIPTNKITLAVTFSGTGNTQFSVNRDLSSLILTSASVDGQLFIIVQHTANTLVAGNSVTASFTISGPNSAYYATIPSITLTLVDPTTFQTFPTATALASPSLSANTATLQLQCSQASLVFWGIGVYPSILNYAAVDFEARIISGGNGLLTNFSEANDYYAKVYGIRQGTTMQVITKTLYNLQSNTNYLFKYFCVNQLGHISDSQSINFTSANYGAYLMKVEVTFRGSITYGQYNDLACSMAQNFIIPYARVQTEAMSYCGNTPYTFYSSSTTAMLNQPDSNGWYIYGFYIEPDYTLASDSTNANIRNQLSISTAATTIITSTSNYINLPSLVQMQTYDIQIYTTPVMSISSPISGLSSVVLTAAITNMNGFIIIGVLSGAFNTSTMTIPSTTNIKQGIFSQNVSLVAVKMMHATQNYNTTFQFTELTANTLYSFFYFCTVEDPSITSLSSAVSVTSAQTLQVLTININWDASLTFFLLPLLVLLLL